MITVSHDLASNLFRFIVALALLPGIFSLGRRLRLPEARAGFLLGLFALIASFGLQVVDQQWGQYVPWLRMARHLVVGLAGFGFAQAAWKVRLRELAIHRAHR